jgi:hypothetical protein
MHIEEDEGLVLNGNIECVLVLLVQSRDSTLGCLRSSIYAIAHHDIHSNTP